VTPPGPREQIDAAIDHLSVAIAAIDRASAAIVSKRDASKAWRSELAVARTDLEITSRRMRDARDELTPSVRSTDPPDAAFATSSTYPSMRRPYDR
jgi:hypothetical protein